jgi:pSer/pThr/pTyr-binding forkhead associated (FHA) protein
LIGATDPSGIVPGKGKGKGPGKGTVIQSTGSGGTEKPVDGKKLVGFLVTYTQAPLGEFFPLYEGKNFIGRDDSVDIRLQKDEEISGKHLSILYRNADRKFKFKDERSSNGTFVNDVLTDEGELQNSDVIRIGSTKLLFMEIKN